MAFDHDEHVMRMLALSKWRMWGTVPGHEPGIPIPLKARYLTNAADCRLM